jgi:hypothetical protein
MLTTPIAACTIGAPTPYSLMKVVLIRRSLDRSCRVLLVRLRSLLAFERRRIPHGSVAPP